MQNKKSSHKKIARPDSDIAPQNFNPGSLTFDHVLFDVSHVANTTTIYDSMVSDRGLKFCGAISGRAIFFTHMCKPRRKTRAQEKAAQK